MTLEEMRDRCKKSGREVTADDLRAVEPRY